MVAAIAVVVAILACAALRRDRPGDAAKRVAPPGGRPKLLDRALSLLRRASRVWAALGETVDPLHVAAVLILPVLLSLLPGRVGGLGARLMVPAVVAAALALAAAGPAWNRERLLDTLTGCANRRAVRGWRRRRRAPASIVAIDLNQLKRINDSAGHAAGDRLLAATGMALRRVVRRGDLVVRCGGDEFLILAGGESSGLPQRVREALRRAGVDASVGSALWQDGAFEQAHAAADAAMYADKRERLRQPAPAHFAESGGVCCGRGVRHGRSPDQLEP